MTWALGETPVGTALTYMTSNAAAKLANVEARYADGITVPAFKAFRMSDPFVEAEPEFPVLYGVAERATGNIVGGGLANGFILTTEAVFVVLYELSADQTGSGVSEAETMRRMGQRYAVAVLEMLADSISSTGVEWATGAGFDIRYGATFTNRDRVTYLSDVQVRIGAQTREAAL